MKLPSQSWRRVAFAAALLAVAGMMGNYALSRASLRQPDRTPLSARLQPLFENTKTVCFGRFVIDVPATATVVYGPGGVDGGDIERYPNESENLKGRVNEEQAAFEHEREENFVSKDFVEENPLFGQVIDGGVRGQKLLYGTRNHATYSIDSYFAIGKDLFVQRANGVIQGDQVLAELHRVASNLRLRDDQEIPTEPGMCFDGSFLPLELPELQFEGVALGVRLKEFPDVHFSIKVDKNGNFLIESSKLEPRLKSAEKDAGFRYWRIAFLRRGERQLGQWRGDEALAHMPAQDNGSDAHEFRFVSLGAVKYPFQPRLDIQLDTGVADNKTANAHPSISDEEAVALWDKLTTSIRVRPTGADKGTTSAASKSPAGPQSSNVPAVPRGYLSASGALCPQSGWWQCAEDGEVADGACRKFKAGQVLPDVVQIGKARWFQRLSRGRPTFTTATIWTLQEYDAGRETAAAVPMTDEAPSTLPPPDVTPGPDGNGLP
jgi:hypothetical protein